MNVPWCWGKGYFLYFFALNVGMSKKMRTFVGVKVKKRIIYLIE